MKRVPCCASSISHAAISYDFAALITLTHAANERSILASEAAD